MKKLLTLLTLITIAVGIMAQSPNKFSYQALVRDSNNKLIPDANIGMQISILQATVNGTAVFVERHFPSTNSNGLVTVEIGSGTLVSGNFGAIDWSNGPYFIKTETDLNGGANYTIEGTSELLSVPYALHSNTAETVTTENDPVFGASAAKGISSSNITSWNNKLDSEVDGSLTNELQTLSISGNKLSISDKNTVELPFLSEIPDNSVTSAKIVNGTIQSIDIGDNQIGASQIAANAVGASEIADMNRTISVLSGSLTTASSYVSSEHRGWQMDATWQANVTGYIALPDDYAGGNVTVSIYFINNSGVSGVVDFFIRAAGRQNGEILFDPGAINPSGGISVSTNTLTLYRQDFTVTNISASDDILHLYSIQRGGSSETHTGTLVLVGLEVQYLASY